MTYTPESYSSARVQIVISTASAQWANWMSWVSRTCGTLVIVAAVFRCHPCAGEPRTASEIISSLAQRCDTHGDLLPPGAIVRLGTVRLRHASVLQSIVFSPDGHVLCSAASS